MKKVFIAVVGVGKLDLLTKIVGSLLLVFAFGGNTFAIDINSNADWAKVGPNDEVTIKMSGTTTIPSDITCKQIRFDQNSTTLNLDNHVLTVGNMYMTNREYIKITNGGTIHATNTFEFKTKGGSINANVIADQNFTMSDQESMTITGNVTVGKDFYMQSKNGKVTGNIAVGGKFYMKDQESMTVVGNVSANGGFVMQSKNGSVTGDVIVSNGDIEMTNQESMSIGGSVNVSGNFTIQSKNVQVGGPDATIEVGGNLSMTNQENMDIEGDVSVDGDVTVQSKNGSITGNVSVRGNLSMTNQENMKINGDVAVAGDLTISGNGSNITGSAAVGGNTNTSNGATISGGTTEYTGPISDDDDQSGEEPGGEEPSGENPVGEEPSGEEPIIPDYTVRATYDENKALNSTSESCSSTIFIIPIDGDNVFHNGFCIYDKNNSRIDIYKDYTIINLTKPVYNGSTYGLRPNGNGSSTIHGWLKLDTKSKTLEYFTSNNKPSCGPVPPTIDIIPNFCIGSTIDVSEYVHWTTTGTGKWVNASNQEIQLSNLHVGDEFYYEAKDNNGSAAVLSNKINVIDKPSISPIGDIISYCAADGGYDLSKHVVNDNGATTTVIWKLNGSTISSSSTPTLNAGDELYVEATNTCDITSATMEVSNACLPKIETIQAIEPICSGEKITLPEPIINYYEEVDGDYGWEIYTGSEWVSFDESESLSNEEYNGKKIRVKACNTIDCSTSNEVTLTVKPNTPEFTVSVSGNSVMEPLGGSSSSVTYTVTKENECNSDDLEVTLSDDNFGYSIDGNKVIVFLKDDTELGTYETKVKFDIGSESKEESLTGLVAEYPKTFILKKICGGAESDYPVTTDENGKLNIQLHSDDNCEYVNEGTIECTEFTLTTSASDHFSGKFVNKGTIKADKIYYGTSSKKLGGSDAVYFDCGGTFIANDLEMNYNTITTSLKGTFLINNSFYIAPAQGQNFEISKCTEIKTYSTDINVSGGSMEISIHGHVNTEYFDVNIPNITSYDDAIITVGHLEASNLNLVISESSLLNLCTNPTKGAPDNIGYIYGTVMYLSDESTGWVDDITPITEGDLNHNDNSSAYWTTKDKYGEPIAKEVIPAYKTYQDCIDEKPDASLLGYDDDPFLPKDKEIYQLYNCNPCSKDFEDAKMEIREIHGKTFRLINGELIYCENDN